MRARPRPQPSPGATCASETRPEVFGNVAGLLTRMGYAARVQLAFRPSVPGVGPAAFTVTALITCAPDLVVGMCLGQVAEEPEAHLPTSSARVTKPRLTDPGPPLVAWWCDDEERPDKTPLLFGTGVAPRDP